MSLDKRFWKPTITSQFPHCPVPYHLDTYRGCVYGCVYCFARDLTVFSRRNSENKEFNYLVGNRADLFKNWTERTMAKKEYDYEKPEEVAFLERIPIKIGANADPFPYIEKKEKITYEFLKILNDIDYPVEIQTKNPEVLLSYADEFIGANWTIAVTLISDDEEFTKKIEPYAPSPSNRLNAIKKLTSMGFNVMIKIQPSIYPKILNDLPSLIKKASDVGVWAFNIEGLKCRISMSKSEQAIFQGIGDTLNMDIREFYKDERKKECIRGADYELSNEKKMEIFKLAESLSKEYGIKFYNADNFIPKGIGDGCECCGTSVLRNYKLLSCDRRSETLGNNKGSKELEKCFIGKSVRSKKFNDLTIKEACDMVNKK